MNAGAGGDGGGNGDDDGNNGGGRRIGDVENGRIPRIPRQQDLLGIFIPLIGQLIATSFVLEEANLSALDSVLRGFALVCSSWGLVFFMASLFERRSEWAARNLSIIGSTLTVLGFISIIAVKLPPNLHFINGLAFLGLLAIFLKAFPA